MRSSLFSSVTFETLLLRKIIKFSHLGVRYVNTTASNGQSTHTMLKTKQSTRHSIMTPEANRVTR